MSRFIRHHAHVPMPEGANPSRCVEILDPDQFLLLFENAERYTQQSAATRNNRVAELPPRVLTRELTPA